MMNADAPFTPAEDATLLRRSRAFEKAGLPESDSGDRAYAMLVRDREGGLDDRRVCFECTHFRNNTCHNGVQAGFVNRRQAVGFDFSTRLQRCPGFKLRGSK